MSRYNMKADRAKQFIPFDALKGLKEALKEKEKIYVEKKELSEEEIVNITITNKKGKVVVDDVVKTNSKGKAKLDLDLKKGKYKVNVSYGGNENYTGSNTTQKLTIKEEVVEATVEQSSSEPQYIGEDGSPISEADYRTLQVYGKSANSQEEWEAQKASLGY